LAFQVNVINHQTVAYTPPKQEGFWDFIVGLFQRANAGEAIQGYTLLKLRQRPNFTIIGFLNQLNLEVFLMLVCFF
jgi:hypothetical protein